MNAPSAAEVLSILPDDPRIDRFRRAMTPEEFEGFYYWLTLFYPFQLEWLFDDARFSITNKGRQIGCSHTNAALLMIWAAFFGEPCMIVSKGETEAENVLAMVKRHADTLRSFGCGEWVKMLHSSAEEVVFASGGSIVALPNTGGRSFSGNILFDEFAYYKNADAVWDAAAPTTMVGKYKLRVISTPNGIGNAFHWLWEIATGETDLVLDDPRIPKAARSVRWKAHEVPLQRAVREGYPVDIAACWTIYAKGDPRLFDQLFNCSFLDSTLQYYTSDLINSCRVKIATDPLDLRGVYYAGLDIGREVDLSVLTIVRLLGKSVDLAHVEAMKRTDSEGLHAMVDWAFKRYRLKRLCVDSTGLGSFPTDEIKKRHGDRFEVSHRRNRVEAVDFTLGKKEDLATNGYSMMSSKRLRLPDGDAQLPAFARRNLDDKGEELTTGPLIPVNVPGTAAQVRKELGAIRRVILPSGNVTYDAPRTKDGHADRAWSLLLALYAVDAANPMVAALQERSGMAG